MQNRDELFIDAAKNGDVEQLQQLMAHIEPGTKTTDRAIRWALRNGHTQCVKMLAPICLHLAGPSASNVLLTLTPLMLAAEMGNVECLEFLLPLSNPRDHDSQALWRAGENGHVDCLNILLPLCCPTTYNFALWKTIESGHVVCVQMLLDAIEQVDGVMLNGELLAWAVRCEQMECLRLLLKVCDSKSDHSLALSWALIYGRTEYVDVLKDLSDVDEALNAIRQHPKMPTGSDPLFWLDFEAQWIKQKLLREMGEGEQQTVRKM